MCGMVWASNASVLRAQTQRTMTLDQTLTLALERSPKLRSSDLGIQSATLASQEADKSRYPSLHYKLGASYAPWSQKFGYDIALTNEGQLNAQLSVQGDIYDGGQTAIKRRQAQLDLAHALGARDLAREGLRFDVTQAFLAELRAQETIELEIESARELQDYRDLVERLFKGGTSGYTDVLKTDVQVGLERLALDKARSDELQARFQLADLLGNQADTAFRLRGSFDSIFSESAYATRSYDSIVTHALRLSQNELDRAKLDVDLAHAQMKPVVNASADAGLLTSVQNLTLTGSDRSSMLGASIGVSVDGPILDWGVNNLQVQEKEVAAQTLEQQLAEQRRELLAALTQLNQLVVDSRVRLSTIRDILKRAQDNYDLVKAKYAVGAALASEVLDAHKQIIDAKNTELQLLSDIESYRANLVHLTAK